MFPSTFHIRTCYICYILKHVSLLVDIALREKIFQVLQLPNAKDNPFNHQQSRENPIPTKLIIFNNYHAANKILDSIIIRILDRSNESVNNVYHFIIDCYNCRNNYASGTGQNEINLVYFDVAEMVVLIIIPVFQESIPIMGAINLIHLIQTLNLCITMYYDNHRQNFETACYQSDNTTNLCNITE